MAVFFLSLILYLVTLFPGVAPYRDTGEMVSVAHTLGIAHPPGYPFYTLLSKAFLLLLPLANAGYRLNVLSALAGAGTAYFVYRIFRKLSIPASLSALMALLFAVSYLQWYLSLVSEMYTLNTFFAALVLYLLVDFLQSDGTSRGASFYAAAFIFGIGLGNRMDLLLIGAAFPLVALYRRKELGAAAMLQAVLLCIAGFTVFAYLPLRSSAAPVLDWNHPADLTRLWGTLTRKTHGGTLDLISEAYAPGENFGPTLMFYFRHLFSGFIYAGLPLGIAGLVSLWKRSPAVAVSTFLGWIVAGPLFIYLANMPPNTHALAILEAHFLLPNLLFMLWIGEGFRAVAGWGGNAWRRGVTVCAAVLVVMNLAHHLPELVKRGNFVAYDYAKNVLRSASKDAVVVMKKDVQLFAGWNQQLVEGRRPDVALVSQGLAGSPWYIDKFAKRHGDVAIGALRTPADWKTLVEHNTARNVYFSVDADYRRPDGYEEEADGLLNRITPAAQPRGETLLTAIYSYRGRYLYSAYREFFTPDLIDDYARAYMNLGQYCVRAGSYERGRAFLMTAIRFRGLIPAAYSTLAYSYLAEGKWSAAQDCYRSAVRQYEALRSLADSFRSLPDAKEGIARELSDVYVALGVCAEKLHDDEEALRQYRAAIETSPAPRAYFNRAVIFWKRNDWQNVTRELDNALRIDPQFKEAAYYRNLAQQKMR